MRTRSPFPGMDPYLERHWLDVHVSLNFLARESLQPQIGESLFARAEERVFVEGPEFERPRPIGPDVQIIEMNPGGTVATLPSVATATSLRFHLDVDPVRQRYLELRDASSGNRLVTVIEFTSPTNKYAGEGRRLYEKKQQECREADVNLVEVDLTRDGRRRLFVSRWPAAAAHASTYAASVWRAAEWADCELFPIRLQDRLPTIPVPLRVGDIEATLDLQAIVDRAYESGAYGRTINYATPPEPPLSPEDAAWAATLLASVATA